MWLAGCMWVEYLHLSLMGCTLQKLIRDLLSQEKCLVTKSIIILSVCP